VATTRVRLDRALVDRGLCTSRTEAQAAIAAGMVLVGGAVASTASRQVAAAEAISLLGPPRRFVSRGGEKLEHALATFDLEVTGQRILDAGASTGGFTDCLLRRGAELVYAVDVGYGQLDHALRTDPRVVVLERCNVRHLTAAELGAVGPPWRPVDLVVADLSFISLTVVLGALEALLSPHGRMVVLVKPQFEADRAAVSVGHGVVRDPAVRAAAVARVVAAAASLGLSVGGITTSPILGPKGNAEFLLLLGRGMGIDSWQDLLEAEGPTNSG